MDKSEVAYAVLFCEMGIQQSAEEYTCYLAGQLYNVQLLGSLSTCPLSRSINFGYPILYAWWFS